MDEIKQKRKDRRREELARELERQKEAFFEWLKDHFEKRPARSRSYQALLLAELLAAAEDPANAWRLKDPLGFLGQVMDRAREELDLACRGVLAEAARIYEPTVNPVGLPTDPQV